MTYSWEIENPTGQLVLVHGIGEHATRWEPHIVSRFLKMGLNVYAYDLEGHGRSAGDRWTTPNFDIHLDDLAFIVEHLGRAGVLADNTYLMGHSLGGLIAASYLARASDPPFVCAILSSGAFQISRDLSPLAQRTARWVSRLLPRWGLGSIPTEKISSLPEAVAAYDSDPLVDHGKIDAETAVSILNQVEWIRTHAANIKTPLLILHGTDDLVNDPEGSQFLYDNVSSDDKSIVFIRDSRHEIFNDVGAGTFFDEIEAMVNRS
jgi:alpha-beta hydrolase superfamily lysophospholipase